MITTRLWLIGASIYPVSYIVFQIYKLPSNYTNYDPPGSLPFWLLLVAVDSMLEPFGIGTASKGGHVVTYLILFLLFLMSAVCLVFICKLVPPKWRPMIAVIVYITLVALNAHEIDVNL